MACPFQLIVTRHGRKLLPPSKIVLSETPRAYTMSAMRHPARVRTVRYVTKVTLPELLLIRVTTEFGGVLAARSNEMSTALGSCEPQSGSKSSRQICVRARPAPTEVQCNQPIGYRWSVVRLSCDGRSREVLDRVVIPNCRCESSRRSPYLEARERPAAKPLQD